MVVWLFHGLLFLHVLLGCLFVSWLAFLYPAFHDAVFKRIIYKTLLSARMKKLASAVKLVKMTKKQQIKLKQDFSCPLS